VVPLVNSRQATSSGPVVPAAEPPPMTTTSGADARLPTMSASTGANSSATNTIDGSTRSRRGIAQLVGVRLVGVVGNGLTVVETGHIAPL